MVLNIKACLVLAKVEYLLYYGAYHDLYDRSKQRGTKYSTKVAARKGLAMKKLTSLMTQYSEYVTELRLIYAEKAIDYRFLF